MAISAGGVGLAALGGVLVWGGLANASPLSVLRDLLAGSPTQIPQGSQGNPTIDNNPNTGAGGTTVSVTAQQTKSIPGVTSIGSSIVNAALSYKDDKYSQANRNTPGYSDCSSFVAKSILAAGIAPCGWNGSGNAPTTLSFAAWGALEGVTDGTKEAGDILLIPGVHIAIVMDANTAIGQENTTINVQQGSWGSIMWEPSGAGYGQYRINLEKV